MLILFWLLVGVTAISVFFTVLRSEGEKRSHFVRATSAAVAVIVLAHALILPLGGMFVSAHPAGWATSERHELVPFSDGSYLRALEDRPEYAYQTSHDGVVTQRITSTYELGEEAALDIIPTCVTESRNPFPYLRPLIPMDVETCERTFNVTVPVGP